MSNIRILCSYDELVDVDTLVRNPENPMRHPEAQVVALAGLMKRVGIRSPIVVSKRSGMITKGHGRLDAALRLKTDGLLEKYPVDYQDYEDAHEEWTDILADNKIPELAEFQAVDAAPHFKAILDQDEELARCIGFADSEVDDMLAGLIDPPKDMPPNDPQHALDTALEHAVELQDKYKTEPGQVWTIQGAALHRLVCGDCTQANVVAACFGPNSPGIMVTDPPYGVTYDPNWLARNLGGQRNDIVVAQDNQADWTAAYDLFTGDIAYVWHSHLHTGMVKHNLEAIGFVANTAIVWNKSHFAISRGCYHWKHEACLYAVRNHKPSHWIGGRNQTTVWDIAKPQSNATGHSTQKPLECMLRPIQNHDCQVVYDPFVGSGTTIVAAEQERRTCVACEIEPHLVAVVLDRCERAFAASVTLAGDV